MNETGAFSEQKVRQQEVLTSLKDLNLLRVLSRSWSTHSFLLCSSSFLFSRFCRQQGETVRCIVVELCSCSVGCLTATITYQVNLVMLAEDYGALLGLQLLLLVGVNALILKMKRASS